MSPRPRYCILCGRLLKQDSTIEDDDWRAKYCCRLCYEVDQTLPTPEDEDLFNLPQRVITLRYNIIIMGETDPIYRSRFEEEEDDLMRDNNDE